MGIVCQSNATNCNISYAKITRFHIRNHRTYTYGYVNIYSVKGLMRQGVSQNPEKLKQGK